MKQVAFAVAAFSFLTSAVEAGVYVTGSVSASTSNVPYQTYDSRYGSGSLGVDLGRYIRLQYTYSQEISVSDAYKDPDDDADATADGEEKEDDNCVNCVHTVSTTSVVGNSLDLQIILYEGQVFVPYIMGGAIVKTYKFETREEGKDTDIKGGTVGPVPNIGAGMGLRLNRDFTLKLSYVASPGLQRMPGDTEPKSVWDKKLTVGLTYQL